MNAVVQHPKLLQQLARCQVLVRRVILPLTLCLKFHRNRNRNERLSEKLCFVSEFRDVSSSRALPRLPRSYRPAHRRTLYRFPGARSQLYIFARVVIVPGIPGGLCVYPADKTRLGRKTYLGARPGSALCFASCVTAARPPHKQIAARRLQWLARRTRGSSTYIHKYTGGPSSKCPVLCLFPVVARRPLQRDLVRSVCAAGET